MEKNHVSSGWDAAPPPCILKTENLNAATERPHVLNEAQLATAPSSQPARYVPRIIGSASGIPVARMFAASQSIGLRARCASTPTSVISVSRAPYAKLLLAASPPLHASIQSR